MKCPRCGSEDDVVRAIEQERAGYVVSILCASCKRQVYVIRDEFGEALEAAEKLFGFGRGGGYG